MNIYVKNFVVSMSTVIIAGLALWASEEGTGGTANIPWLLLVGFGAGCLALSAMTWLKRRGAAGAAKTTAPEGKKKGRK